MQKGMIQGLYDMAGVSPTGQEMTSAEEAKLRKALDGNKKLFSSNKEIFKDEPKFHTCSLYDPCPICSKCRNKGSHLYVRCQVCTIPICTHTYKDRTYMIRRDNFKLAVSLEIKEGLLEMAKEANP